MLCNRVTCIWLLLDMKLFLLNSVSLNDSLRFSFNEKNITASCIFTNLLIY